jgi:hypothetical protein
MVNLSNQGQVLSQTSSEVDPVKTRLIYLNLIDLIDLTKLNKTLHG